MKKLRRKTLMVSILLMGASFLTPTFAAETPVECFDAGTRSSNFGILAYKNTYLEGEIEKDCPKDVVIPDTISGQQVKYIKRMSFQNKDLTSVILPEGLEEIWYSAFQGNKLTSITIPSTVKKIGYRAFIDNQIATLNFAEGSQLTQIDYSAFEKNQITTLVIPDSVETIGSQAFNQNSLTSVTIWSSVTSIWNEAFLNNTNISSLTIKGNSLKTIGNKAFFYVSLTGLVIPDSVETIGDDAFAYSKLTNLTLGAGVKTIGDRAFYNCLLSKVSFNENLETIGNHTFKFNKLSEVNFKEKLVSIGDSAFADNKPGGEVVTVQGYINKDPSTVTIGTNAGIVLSRSPHNLTFDTNGGSTIAPQIYGKDALIVKPTDPTKDGYTFDGWYKEVELTNQWNFSTDTMPNNDLTLYAKWTPTSYTITYNLDGGSNGSNPANYTIETADITLQEATKVGHTFAGRYDAAEGGTKIATIALGSFGDKTLYARWTVNQYPVTFNSNEGSDVDPQMVDYETKITEPTAPTKTGYTFLGWYKEVELTNQWNFSTDTMPLDGTTLYAKWVQSKYTVTFKNGYEEAPLKTETVEYGKDAIAPADPTRVGHTFQGWDLAFTNVTSDLTITATWEINTYTVTFSVDGGSEITPQNINHGSTITVVPEKAGYGFWGWFTDAGFSTETEWVSTNPVVENMTLYAKWNVNEYTVVFKNGYDETILQSSSVAHGGTVTAPADPTRAGHTFKGWDKELTAITSALTITATWEINTYTVTFDTNGGSAVDIQNIAYQAKILKPADSTQAEYVFKGWYRDAGFTTLRDFATDTMPAENITLYAKWAPAVKISFDTKWGSAIVDQWIEKSMPLTKPSDPTKDGYTFDGWFTDTELTTAWDFATTIDTNTTLYAKWKVKSSSSSSRSGGGSGGKKVSNNNSDPVDPKAQDKKTDTSDETTKPVEIEGFLKTLTEDFLKDHDEVALHSLTEALNSINHSEYDPELKNSYLYAYLRGITTMDTIEKAELERGMTRAEMAKMMVMFAQKVLGKETLKTDTAQYKDLKGIEGDLPGYIQLAYQLQIMGVDAKGNAIPEFNPHALVSRAEFATVLSRVMFGNKYNQEGADYSSAHLSALKEAGILSNTDPAIQELRGWVMLMLMRTENVK